MEYRNQDLALPVRRFVVTQRYHKVFLQRQILFGRARNRAFHPAH